MVREPESDRETGARIAFWSGDRRDLQPERKPTGDVSALLRFPRFGTKYLVPVLEGT